MLEMDDLRHEGQYRGLGELSYPARSRLKELTAEHQSPGDSLAEFREEEGATRAP